MANNGSTNTSGNTFIGGIFLPEIADDAVTSLSYARNDGFEYCVTELPVPPGISSASANGGAEVVRTDVTRLESKWWSTSVVGMVADPPHWDVVDDAVQPGNELLRVLTTNPGNVSKAKTAGTKKDEAERILWGMMEWASHMNIPAVILPSVPLTEFTDKSITNGSRNEPTMADSDEDIFDESERNTFSSPLKTRSHIGSSDENNSSAALFQRHPTTSLGNNFSAKEYTRLISALSTSAICTSSHVQLWVRVPLTLQHLQAYQLLLSRCDNSSHIGCMLYVCNSLDAASLPAIVRALHNFLGGGNVKAVSWDTSVFLKNKKGYPTLSKSHQFVFQLLFGRLGRTLRVLMEGNMEQNTASNGGNAGGSSGGSTKRLHYLQYLRHLRSRAPLPSILDSEEATIETPYLDHLQSPLQPLGDHLEYQTYETFEKDPVKYLRYGEAVALALEDVIAVDKLRYLGSTTTTVEQLNTMNRLAKLAAESGGYVGEGAGLLNVGDDEDDITVGNDEEIVEVDIHEVTIMVVGAGRGPLVREAIAAVSRVSASWMKDHRYDLSPEEALKENRPSKRRKAIYAKVVAIEKNPSAILYLNSFKAGDPSWNGGHEYNPSSARDNFFDPNADANEDAEGQIIIPGTSNVIIIGCDMREATSHPLLQYMIQNPGSRAEIVVSELLGSFGDNELSPECLDGVQRCGVLKETCVSIPQSYTSFIAPVSSARLHSEAKNQASLPINSNEGPASPSSGMQRALETPYVVRTHAASQTHLEKGCWTFSHPHHSDLSNESMACSSAEAAKDINNDRCAHLSFPDRDRNAGVGCGYGAFDADVASMSTSLGMTTSSKDTPVTIHGFLGSFHSVLYESPPMLKRGKDRSSVISIAPSTFSVGMFSWFPLYFPLKSPLLVPPGATVNCSIWRRSDDGRVWYEWCAEVESSGDHGEERTLWSVSSMHNPGGRSYHVRL